MADVPHNPVDIRGAAGDRAGAVADHLDALGADLARPRPGGLADVDRDAGVAALAAAAAALRDVVAALGSDESPTAGGAAGPNGRADGDEDAEHD